MELKSHQKDQLIKLRAWMLTDKYEEEKLILKLNEQKRSLELIGLPHKEINKEFVVIEKEHAQALLFSIGKNKTETEALNIFEKNEKVLDVLSELSNVIIKDKAGTFIGARMGRPEKAKMRKLTGSPHAMFPVGEQGGRLRSFQSAFTEGKIIADVQMYKCKKCSNITPFRVCELCESKTDQVLEEEKKNPYDRRQRPEIQINKIMEAVKKKIGTNIIPDLIKGVRGLASKERIAEHLVKGILRAKYNLTVNKNGTIR